MPYSTSFKKKILDQCRNGASVFTVSEDSGVSRSTIYRWFAEAGAIETKDKVYSVSNIKALERKVEK